MEAGADDVLDRSNGVLNLAEKGWSLLGLSARGVASPESVGWPPDGLSTVRLVLDVCPESWLQLRLVGRIAMGDFDQFPSRRRVEPFAWPTFHPVSGICGT